MCRGCRCANRSPLRDTRQRYAMIVPSTTLPFEALTLDREAFAAAQCEIRHKTAKKCCVPCRGAVSVLAWRLLWRNVFRPPPSCDRSPRSRNWPAGHTVDVASRGSCRFAAAAAAEARSSGDARLTGTGTGAVADARVHGRRAVSRDRGPGKVEACRRRAADRTGAGIRHPVRRVDGPRRYLGRSAVPGCRCRTAYSDILGVSPPARVRMGS